jgi:hypothetical protein
MAGILPWAPSYNYDPANRLFNFNGSSGDPSLSVAAPTLGGAETEWFQANPEDQQFDTPQNLAGVPNQSGVGGNPGINATPPILNLTPQYLSQMFPNGLPAATPTTAATSSVGAPDLVSNIMSAANGIPQVAAPSVLGELGSELGPQALENNVLGALAPQFKAQQQALNEQLAAAGIVGGSAPGATVDLAAQQNQQAAAALAPYEQSAEQMRLNAATTDAGNALTASGANASNAIGTGNNLSQLIMQAALANQSTGAQVGEWNAGALNAGNQFNVANLIQGGQFDINNYQQMQQLAAQLQNQDYLAQLQLQGQLATGGQAGQTGAFQPTFYQPPQTNLSGFAPVPTATSGGAPSTAPNNPAEYNGQVAGGSGNPPYTVNPNPYSTAGAQRMTSQIMQRAA